LKLVDLFSGCGGFSHGAHRAGFDVRAAYDNDPVLCSSYVHNFPKTKHILADVAKLSASTVQRDAGGMVDGVFGGPPCQGFSSIGKRSPSDPRRQLLGHFFRLVRELQPKFFVMENVVGLQQGSASKVLQDAIREVSDGFKIGGPWVLDAASFGAATKRPRLFVIGISKKLGVDFEMDDLEKQKCEPTSVKDAIGDLAGLVPTERDNADDLWKIDPKLKPSEYARALRSSNLTCTGNARTKHTETVVQRFREVEPGGSDKVGRHPRLSWDGQCPTLRAGTGSDKGSFQSVRPIHPVEPRVITVREAARLQGFPDAHVFHSTIWHSFRMIGNSVSPIIAEAIFKAIQRKLEGNLTPVEMAAR
jgi:DNA (cytosine-5)-methyltransferase 1